MSVIERLKTYFPVEVYPAINDTGSELYILLNAIANSFESFYDAIAVMHSQLNMVYATGYSIDLLGNSFNVDKFQGEDESMYRLRFKSMTGMDKPTKNGIFDITKQFCLVSPTIVEKGSNEVDITINGSTSYAAFYFFTIGTDGSYGSGIADSDKDSAGAIYSNVESSIIVSLTYLQNLLDLVKPVGTKINLLEGA